MLVLERLQLVEHAVGDRAGGQVAADRAVVDQPDVRAGGDALRVGDQVAERVLAAAARPSAAPEA
jgi:hypothetical protein